MDDPNDRGRTDYSRIAILVALWEHNSFRGRRALVARDTRHLSPFGMNDTVTAIGVHPGPNFDPASEWVVTIFEHQGFTGRSATLGVGTHADLRQLKMNDTVTSLQIRSVGKGDLPFVRGGQPIGTIAPIPAIAELFEKPNFQGRSVLVFEPIANLGDYAGFNDRPRSMRVYRGPNFDERSPGLWFFQHHNFQGERGSLRVGDYAELPKFLDAQITSIHFNETGK